MEFRGLPRSAHHITVQRAHAQPRRQCRARVETSYLDTGRNANMTRPFFGHAPSTPKSTFRPPSPSAFSAPGKQWEVHGQPTTILTNASPGAATLLGDPSFRQYEEPASRRRGLMACPKLHQPRDSGSCSHHRGSHRCVDQHYLSRFTSLCQSMYRA